MPAQLTMFIALLAICVFAVAPASGQNAPPPAGGELPADAGELRAGESSTGPTSRPFEASIDRSDWFVYEGVDEAVAEGTILDVSHLLDAPAGKHGPLRTRGEAFVFEDGTPIRFWGTNLSGSACFPDKALADQMVRQLRRTGCNLVRLHHMDQPWPKPNIFGNNPTTTRQLDPAAMERLDYLVAELRRSGIYISLGLLVSRQLKPGDGIAYDRLGTDALKTEGQFAPELIELQKEFITQLLNRRNPHTGLTYAEDPAVVMTEVTNEDSLFYIAKGKYKPKAGYYADLFQKQFNEWLMARYATRGALEKAWSAGEGKGLASDEDPAAGTVGLPQDYRDAGFTRQRVLDTYRFIYDTQDRYLREMMAHIRAQGFSGLVAGSNHWVADLADLHMNAKLGDWVDRHTYWAHPSGGFRYSSTQVRVDRRSMLESEWFGMVGSVAGRRVAGKPYLLSEWQISAPNPYRVEAQLIFPAYACLHNWNGTQFLYRTNNDGGDALSHVLDVFNQPGWMALWPAMARLYHRQDVQQAERSWFLPVSPEAALDPAARFAAYPAGRYVTNKLALLGRTGVGFTDLGFDPSSNDPALLEQARRSDGVFRSTTGELLWDAPRKQFTIDTPRTQGFSGFPQSGLPIETRDAAFAITTDFACVVLSSADDGASIADSRTLLLTVAARSEPQGLKLVHAGDDKIQIAETGSKVTLVQPVEGTVTLRGERPLRVYRLSPSGARRGEITTRHVEGGIAFDLRAEHEAMHYEIER